MVNRPATLFLCFSLFALALLTSVLRGIGAGIGTEVDTLLRRRRALERSVGEWNAGVESLRAPSRILGRAAGPRGRSPE